MSTTRTLKKKFFSSTVFSFHYLLVCIHFFSKYTFLDNNSVLMKNRPVCIRVLMIKKNLKYASTIMNIFTQGYITHKHFFFYFPTIEQFCNNVYINEKHSYTTYVIYKKYEHGIDTS